jgi:hypothetical protein
MLRRLIFDIAGKFVKEKGWVWLIDKVRREISLVLSPECSGMNFLHTRLTQDLGCFLGDFHFPFCFLPLCVETSEREFPGFVGDFLGGPYAARRLWIVLLFDKGDTRSPFPVYL